VRRLVFALALLSGLARAQQDPTDDEALPQLKGEAKARIQNLEQYLEDWDVAGAKAELAELEKLAPADIEPVRYFRGRIAFEEGEYQKAFDELSASGVRDKPGSWLRLVKDTRDLVKDHQRAESAHFIFLYPKGKDGVLVPWALEALEGIHAALAKDLGHTPTGKIRVEIVSSATELAKVSTLSREAIRTTGTIAICKFNKLMVTSPKAVVRGYDWLDTLAHEYVHLVVSQKSRNTVPIWMHEGLAKYLESRWRGPAGGAMTPSTLALLGSRVRSNTLVPFEKMHPSMALLPTAEDAATAFAEVFFAMHLVDTESGPGALARLLAEMGRGSSDKAAVEAVTKKKWPEFERAWMAHLKKQPYPKELIPPSAHEKKQLIEGQADGKDKDGKKKKPQRDVSFGDFAEVAETPARKAAHLGELMRERRRMGAAAEHYQKAYALVGDRYESVSNKYALTLLELKRFDEAEKVLQGSLVTHPGSAATNTHLARIALRAKKFDVVKKASLDALAVNPFDPEVHVSLYLGAKKLGDDALSQRAVQGLVALLDIDPSKVAELAKRLEQSNLVDVDVTGPPPPPPAAPAPDAG
jgi:tetratricopeptide (TPR) repeat protein